MFCQIVSFMIKEIICLDGTKQTKSSLEFRTGFSLENFAMLSLETISKLNPVWNSELDSVWKMWIFQM